MAQVEPEKTGTGSWQSPDCVNSGCNPGGTGLNPPAVQPSRRARGYWIEAEFRGDFTWDLRSPWGWNGGRSPSCSETKHTPVK